MILHDFIVNKLNPHHLSDGHTSYKILKELDSIVFYFFKLHLALMLLDHSDTLIILLQ